MNHMDFDALNFLGQHLLTKRWIFAKTMPENPHWYTLRKEWVDDGLFDRVVETLRRIAYTRPWKKAKYQTVNLNGFMYWTMGAPIPATILINRAQIEFSAAYDQIAGIYDGLFSDPASLKENQEVFDLLGYRMGESVLDVGCGTGLFLDYAKPYWGDYFGIDPSTGMLRQFVANHPTYSDRLMVTPFEEYVGPQVDLVVSLFAAPSYIHPLAVHRLADFARPGGRWFAMFYKDDYSPVTYERAGVNLSHFFQNHLKLPGTLTELGNFYVVQGRKSL